MLLFLTTRHKPGRGRGGNLDGLTIASLPTLLKGTEDADLTVPQFCSALQMAVLGRALLSPCAGTSAPSHRAQDKLGSQPRLLLSVNGVTNLGRSPLALGTVASVTVSSPHPVAEMC